MYILTAAFLWGSTGIYFKELSALGASSIQIVFIRTSIAMLGLGLWFSIKNREAFRIRLKDLWCFAGTGLISLLSFNWFLYRAIEEIGMAVSGVLLYTAPAIVTVLSAVLFKEKLKRSGWYTLVIILLGCALVSGVANDNSQMSVSGIMFGLGSGLGYALYSIFSRYALLRGYSAQTISFYTFTFCAFGSVPFVAGAAPSSISLFVLAESGTAWFFALAIGILGCLFPYWLYTKGLSGVTGATASMTATFEPVVFALFGVILYHEVLEFWQIAGMVLVLGGILVLAKTGSEDTQTIHPQRY